MYTSCDNIPTSIFFKIVNTSDLKYMFNDSNKKISKSDLEKASKTFENIMLEYSDLSKNKKLIQNYKAQIRISYLEFKYETAINIIEIYNKYKDLKIINLLNDLDYSIDITKNIENQIKKILSKLIGLKNSIKIEKVKFENKFNVNDDDKNTNINIFDEAVIIEKILDLKYSLDPDKTVLSKWIALINMCKETRKEL